MAKSKSFFGLRKGSTKTLTFSVLKGQQITKDRVTTVSNPKTTAQMLQRATLAAVVKFYKEAVSHFFKFAFQFKGETESDYNAFVRANMQGALPLAYIPSKSAYYPAIGRNFIISDGSLTEVPVSYSTAGVPQATVSGVLATETTVGAISAHLIADGLAIAGDIVTVVVYTSSLESLNDIPLQKPKWHMAQFIVDTDSTIPLDSAEDMTEGITAIAGGLALGSADTTHACAATVIISRQTGNGLEVSHAEMHGNSVWESILEQMDTEAYRARVAVSWGATGLAILQGSLVQ